MDIKDYIKLNKNNEQKNDTTYYPICDGVITSAKLKDVFVNKQIIKYVSISIGVYDDDIDIITAYFYCDYSLDTFREYAKKCGFKKLDDLVGQKVSFTPAITHFVYKNDTKKHKAGDDGVAYKACKVLFYDSENQVIPFTQQEQDSFEF